LGIKRRLKIAQMASLSRIFFAIIPKPEKQRKPEYKVPATSERIVPPSSEKQFESGANVGIIERSDSQLGHPLMEGSGRRLRTWRSVCRVEGVMWHPRTVFTVTPFRL